MQTCAVPPPRACLADQLILNGNPLRFLGSVAGTHGTWDKKAEKRQKILCLFSAFFIRDCVEYVLKATQSRIKKAVKSN